MNTYHCPEYEELTMEEKILVDKEMKERWGDQGWGGQLINTYYSQFVSSLAEKMIIEIIIKKWRQMDKEKELEELKME